MLHTIYHQNYRGTSIQKTISEQFFLGTQFITRSMLHIMEYYFVVYMMMEVKKEINSKSIEVSRRV